MSLIYSIATKIANALDKDKLLHYTISKLIFIALFLILSFLSIQYALFIAAGITWSIGTIKELIDLYSDKGHAAFADIVANTLGILSTAVPLYLVLYIF